MRQGASCKLGIAVKKNGRGSFSSVTSYPDITRSLEYHGLCVSATVTTLRTALGVAFAGSCVLSPAHPSPPRALPLKGREAPVTASPVTRHASRLFRHGITRHASRLFRHGFIRHGFIRHGFSVTRHGLFVTAFSAASYCCRGCSPLPPPHLQCRRQPGWRSGRRIPFRRPPPTNPLPNRLPRSG